MQERCENCLKNLRDILGEAEMQGSRVVVPDRQIDASQQLKIAGRTVRLLYFGWASTPGDLVVLDQKSGIAFAGGLVSLGRVPDLHDANLKGWLGAIDRLKKTAARIIVPGFGPPARLGDIVETRAYLKALDAAVRAQYRNGTSLLEAPRNTPLPLFQNKKMYSNLHPRNVQQRYLEIEREEFNR